MGNRPYGIGIFLEGKADLIKDNKITNTQFNAVLVQRVSEVSEISRNTITDSGLSGVFVENKSKVALIKDNTVTGNGTCTSCTFSKAGLSVLLNSTVGTVDNNNFDGNALGLEMAGSSTISSVVNSTFDSNTNGGASVRENSVLTSFSKNKVRNNRGQGGMQIEAATGEISSCEISDNGSTGINFTARSRFTLLDSSIVGNNKRSDGQEGSGGISLDGGSELMLFRNIISHNIKNGILATGAATWGRLMGGNNVTRNQGFGLSAQGAALLECTGSNTIAGNTSGDKTGNVMGCP